MDDRSQPFFSTRQHVDDPYTPPPDTQYPPRLLDYAQPPVQREVRTTPLSLFVRISELFETRVRTRTVRTTRTTDALDEALETTRMPAHPTELINTLRMPKALVPQQKREAAPVNQVRIDQHRARGLNLPYLTRVMTRQEQGMYTALLLLWVLSLVFLWVWWLRPEHVVTVPGMIVNSLVLLWSTVLPGYYFFFVARMHKPDPALPLPQGRVAIIVTKAPSEPWSVLQKTLIAMKTQRFDQSGEG